MPQKILGVADCCRIIWEKYVASGWTLIIENLIKTMASALHCTSPTLAAWAGLLPRAWDET
ncbi:MAG: hypothetical protein ACXWO1_07790, partial [Isosphaeraceae bacterium]